MKAIYNWRKATVFDIESDGLLEMATKLHVLGFQMQDKDIKSFHGQEEIERIKAFFQWHIDNQIPVVAHNGIWFDIPLVQKLLNIDLSNLMVIDSLALSWYLNTNRPKHGLDSFFEDYRIAKPVVRDDEWIGLNKDEEEIIKYYEQRES